MVKQDKIRICTPPVSTGMRTASPQRSKTAPNYVSSSWNWPDWSGYVATDGGFDWVFADWNVPCYNPSSPSKSTAATWVGLGGWFEGNLLQGGTTEFQQYGYQFWFETYDPSGNGPYENLTTIGSLLNCGDSVAVQADYNISCSNGSAVHFSDYSTNQYTWTKCISWAPSNTDADWIDERLTCASNGIDSQLANFNYTSWSNAQAESTYYSNDVKSISYYDDFQIIMVDGSTDIAFPSNISSSSFYDYWERYGSYHGC